VTTIAKRDLKRGEVIDSYGGFTVYGGIENYERARDDKLLPLGLSVGAELVEDVSKGSVITHRQVSIPDSPLLELRGLQDGMHECTI
jgi:predicted homoserine dehydrogenase-like protein